MKELLEQIIQMKKEMLEMQKQINDLAKAVKVLSCEK